MRRWYAAAAVLLVLAAGCSDDGGGDGDDGTSPSGTPASSPTRAAPTDGPTSGSTTPSAGGTAEPTTALLDWTPLGEPGRDTVVRGDGRTMTVPASGARATITGAGGTTTVPAGPDRKITDAWLDGGRAIVVSQDRFEERPLSLLVVDLASGDRSTVTTPRPGPGGSVAYADGILAYTSYRPGGSFCLATYDVAAGRGEQGYCAPKGHGFSNLSVSPEGVALMTFDDRRPVSCRTLASADGTRASPLAGVPECKGWDVLRTDGGAVWSVVTNERRVELGDFFARSGDAVTALGPGTTGTLRWCGGSAYFVRDAQEEADKARLLRWTPGGTLEVVYETRGEGEAFLAEPACADGILTVRAYAEGGDDQVWAPAPG
jgi:hypothetical protein